MDKIINWSEEKLEAKTISIIDGLATTLEKYIEDALREDYMEYIDKCEVRINRNLRSSAGRYKHSRATQLREEKIIIEFHQELTEEVFIDVAKHEALHLLTGIGDIRWFKNLCNQLNIPTHHEESFSTLPKVKYKTICTKCGKVTGRYKRKSKVIKRPSLYHSNCCLADIKVIEIE